MKRICAALILSYVATCAILLGLVYARREVGQIVGTVSFWQEIEVPDYKAGEFGNVSSELPFFWIEIGASKKVYAQVKKRSEYVPYFELTTDLRRSRFEKGLFVEVWDYDWSFEGAALSRKLEQFFPIARDEILGALKAQGIEARPKGTIIQSDERNRSMAVKFLLLGLACIPAVIVTALVMRKREANKSATANALDLT